MRQHYQRSLGILVIMTVGLAGASCTSHPSKKPEGGPGATASGPPFPGADECPLATTSFSRTLGVFDNAIPGGKEDVATLQWEHDAGFGVTVNYLALAAKSRSDIKAYLDRAHALGLQVIISLNDLYPEIPRTHPWIVKRQKVLFGTSDPEQQALAAVQAFANHPAVWGFSITDIVPEMPAELDSWPQRFINRCRRIKQITPKPLVAILRGWTSVQPDVRLKFERAVKAGADYLFLDNRPYPDNSHEGPLANIATVAHEVQQVAGRNGGFVLQTLGWEGYPPPTKEQIIEMARLAYTNGARHVFIHLVDRPEETLDPERMKVVQAAIPDIKPYLKE